MPELPEVETVCRGLSSTILGGEIVSAENLRPNLRIPFPENFSEKLKGRKIKEIKRRAKYILITLDDDLCIIAHLGMSGQMIVYNNFQNDRKKHDHAVFRFADGKEMVFNDPRRFGLITFAEDAASHKLINKLGIEPLLDEFTGSVLYNILQKRKSPVKNTIMDASLIVGVGNIYACEALFRSNVLPDRPSNKVKKQESEALCKNIKDVLNEAINSGGSTLKDYAQSSGESGYFQHSFKVYGREGESCVVCNNIIQRIKQSGRSSFFCPNCQR